MRDAQINKRRSLRRRARSSQNTSKLFNIYNPLFSDEPDFDDRDAWSLYQDAKYGWIQRLAGHWCAVACEMPSYVRRDANRLTRTRQKTALRQAVLDDALEDFTIPSHRRTVRWDWR